MTMLGNWTTRFRLCSQVEITDNPINNGCTKKEVLGLEYYFEYCAKRLTLSSARAATFDLAEYRTSKERSVDQFILTIERQRIDETNRICDDTEDFDIYTGTFTHKTNGTSVTMEGQAPLLKNPNSEY